MEQWSARDERPYLRESVSSSGYLWWAFFALLLIAGGGAAYFLYPWLEVLPPEKGTGVEASAPAPVPVAGEAAAPASALTAEEPAPPSVAAKQLPSLEQSDALMRDALTGLVGRPAFDAMVYPSQLIRRIVATVDNLPRETAPRRVMPLEPVPGRLGVAPEGEEYTLSAVNADRYTPYVRVFDTLDARALAKRYFDSYPLFQRAYAELGFPGREFHTRLLEAIDDLLAAPEPKGDVKLLRPKVLYEFADPELEALSAGQKIMVRMGPEHARKVKGKLREIRRALTAKDSR